MNIPIVPLVFLLVGLLLLYPSRPYVSVVSNALILAGLIGIALANLAHAWHLG